MKLRSPQWLMNKIIQDKVQAALDQSYEQLLASIRKHRHDWMNDVQLLYGYVQLDRMDKLRDHVDWIKEKTAQERMLFQLGIPRFIVDLYTFNSRSKSLKLVVELEEEIHLDELELDPAFVTTSVMDTLEMFDQVAEAMADNQLTLVLYVEDHILTVQYEFTGQYDQTRLQAMLSDLFDETHSRKDILVQSQEREEWATMTLQFPFQPIHIEAKRK